MIFDLLRRGNYLNEFFLLMWSVQEITGASPDCQLTLLFQGHRHWGRIVASHLFDKQNHRTYHNWNDADIYSRGKRWSPITFQRHSLSKFLFPINTWCPLTDYRGTGVRNRLVSWTKYNIFRRLLDSNWLRRVGWRSLRIIQGTFWSYKSRRFIG
jgi:hypothetical protein